MGWLLLLASAGPAEGQSVRGRVMEQDGTPVPAATVELLEPDGGVVDRTVTEIHGGFFLRAREAGPHRVVARRLGLLHPLERGVEVPSRGEVSVLLVALPDPIVLAEIATEVDRREPFLEAQGFYRRSSGHLGTFFDRAAVDSLRPRGVNDLLRRTPGVRFKHDRLGRLFPYFRDPLGAYSLPCYPLVFVDGLEMRGSDGNVEVFVHPDDIAGMEVYPGGAVVPARFARVGHACGVIAFWTRLR